MSDHLLFAVAPYLAVLAWVLASALRCAAGVRHPEGNDQRPSRAAAVLVRTVVSSSALVLLVGHLVLLIAPEAVLRWNRSISRLLLLEGAGVFFGAVCLAAVVGSIRQHLFGTTRHAACSLGDTVVLTLLAMEVASGISLAVVYRWASSWSVVTLTPYAVSVMKLRPRVELVGAMPFLVRLHVFCTFAIVALIPFSVIGSLALIAVGRVVGALTAPLSRACGSAGVEDWIRRNVRSHPTWGEEES
jgi:nitrate reductase gamma subunit